MIPYNVSIILILVAVLITCLSIYNVQKKVSTLSSTIDELKETVQNIENNQQVEEPEQEDEQEDED